MRVFCRLEMWCRRQAAAAILPLLLAGWLTGESEAFSTFGRSNTQPPNEVTTTPLPARSCKSQGECAGISGTSCVTTHYDSTPRCLCGDYLPPVNGQCEGSQIKNLLLYHICSNSAECNDGLICGTPNVTGTAPSQSHLSGLASTDRICLCDTENGYREKEHSCSARSCKSQGECAGISGTSCVTTHYDATPRCLCGDNLSPVNGQCEGSQIKNLYHICSYDYECNEELICGTPNVTGTAPSQSHLRGLASTDRICLCDTENEYSCSDADILKTSIFAIIFVSCIRKLMVY